MRGSSPCRPFLLSHPSPSFLLSFIFSFLSFPLLSSFCFAPFFPHVSSAPDFSLLSSFPFPFLLLSPSPVSIPFFHFFPCDRPVKLLPRKQQRSSSAARLPMPLTMTAQIMPSSRSSQALARGLRGPFIFQRPDLCRSS